MPKHSAVVCKRRNDLKQPETTWCGPKTTPNEWKAIKFPLWCVTNQNDRYSMALDSI